MVVPRGWLSNTSKERPKEKPEQTMSSLAAGDPVGLWTAAAAAPLIVYMSQSSAGERSHCHCRGTGPFRGERRHRCTFLFPISSFIPSLSLSLCLTPTRPLSPCFRSSRLRNPPASHSLPPLPHTHPDRALKRSEAGVIAVSFNVNPVTDPTRGTGWRLEDRGGGRGPNMESNSSGVSQRRVF